MVKFTLRDYFEEFNTTPILVAANAMKIVGSCLKKEFLQVLNGEDGLDAAMYTIILACVDEEGQVTLPITSSSQEGCVKAGKNLLLATNLQGDERRSVSCESALPSTDGDLSPASGSPSSTSARTEPDGSESSLSHEVKSDPGSGLLACEIRSNTSSVGDYVEPLDVSKTLSHTPFDVMVAAYMLFDQKSELFNVAKDVEVDDMKQCLFEAFKGAFEAVFKVEDMKEDTCKLYLKEWGQAANLRRVRNQQSSHPLDYWSGNELRQLLDLLMQAVKAKVPGLENVSNIVEAAIPIVITKGPRKVQTRTPLNVKIYFRRRSTRNKDDNLLVLEAQKTGSCKLDFGNIGNGL